MQNLFGVLQVHVAAIPPVASLYGCCRTNAGFGDRRNYGDLHVDPRGNAALVTGYGSGTTLSDRRGR